MPLETKEKNNFYYDISGLAMLSFRNAVAMNWLHWEVDAVCLRSTQGVPSRYMQNETSGTLTTASLLQYAFALQSESYVQV
jgi:hypothetical protein